MSERYLITFTEGGVGLLETIATGGLAVAAEKALDAVTGDNNHGWYCNIKDTVTEVEVNCWGSTKSDAQEKAFEEIKRKIEYFEDEQEREYAENKEKEKAELRQRQLEQSRETPTSTQSSSSDESGCATLIAWLVGIGIVIFVVIWLAVNVVLPVALLNSALALAILSLVFKKYKTLFASFALVGGGYMLLDITNGWLSVNFVEKVVKNPDWISAFVYINAAAIGWCTWLLVQPFWSKTKQIETTEKNKSILIKIGLIILIILGTLLAPVVYYSVQNPFNQKVSHYQSNSQSQSVSQKNEAVTGTSKTQLEMTENQVIIDTYLGTIGNKEFKLFIEKVDGENVEGYNVTGSNRRPVKGRIVNKWNEPTGLGGNYTIFKLILTEPGDNKWDGEFNIDLWISDQGRSGKGSWKSFNGKLEHQIIIKDRLN